MVTLKHIKAYYFPIFLTLSILAGSLTGYVLGPRVVVLKPFGDIFLNLLFTVVVPLVFFSIASSVAHIGGSTKLLKIISAMFATFIFTGIIAAAFMIVVVNIFPPAQGVILKLGLPDKIDSINVTHQIVNIFTVSDFTQLLSHKSMLPLIFFSLLVGLATSTAKVKGRPFALFLKSGAEVMMRVISFIMYYAPIGFFAYFALLVGEMGPQLIANYFRVMLIYYAFAMIYFVLAFTFYAYLGGGKNKVIAFWKNVFMPMITALATCSSAASIPANLQATKDMGVSTEVYETVVPMGAMLHKDGSVLGAIIKISFLFGIFGMSFSGPTVILTALTIAILVGTVMGAIPSGGMLGEMLILTLYGFPPQALLIIAAISIIIDPLATMLNVTGDNVCSMMVDRLLHVHRE
jgi:Na+/H+-dicarboxylate symporter